MLAVAISRFLDPHTGRSHAQHPPSRRLSPAIRTFSNSPYSPFPPRRNQKSYQFKDVGNQFNVGNYETVTDTNGEFGDTPFISRDGELLPGTFDLIVKRTVVIGGKKLFANQWEFKRDSGDDKTQVEEKSTMVVVQP